MRATLLVTRPLPEAETTARAARDAGFVALMAPLFHIEEQPAERLEAMPDALLLTSARSAALARAAWPQLAETLPVVAVGPKTAAAARAAGFQTVHAGASDGSEALRLAARLGLSRLLHARGAAGAPMAVPAGVRLETRILYRAVAATRLPDPAIAALADGAAALLFSPRTARIFARCVEAAGLARACVGLAVLSPAVAHAAADGWRAIAVARRPTTEAILAAARTLWHGRPAGETDGRQR
jgi:uroporphyrinogen-III synthase